MARFMRDGLGRLSAALIAVLAILGLNAAAFAVEVAPTPAKDLGNPDLGKDGSITVHKYETPNPALTSKGNGAPLNTDTTQDWTALGEVPFTIQKLKLDLNDSANWKKIKDLEFDGTDVKSGTETIPLDPKVKVTQSTANDGSTKFENLKAGVYLVTEGDTEAHTILKKAAPFFVTIPMPNPDAKEGSEGWLYDVHVYPKNEITEVEKTVDDSNGLLGSEENAVQWTVTAKVPNLASGETHTRLEVSDTFDPRLEFVTVSSVKLGDKGLTKDAEDGYTVTQDGQKVVVAIKNPATTLADYNGKYLEVVFDTKVRTEANEGTQPGGVIKNTAEVFINNPDSEEGITTNGVETKWGWLKLHKQDGVTKKALEGAEFGIYLSEDDAKADTDGSKAKGKIRTSDKGDAQIMLKVGKDNADATYWVKELKAPAGYVLDSKPFSVTITAKNLTEASVHNVDNTKQSVPGLPVTGAAGTLLLTIGGGAVLLAALGTAFVAMRRRARA